jgi:hypothetical protein
MLIPGKALEKAVEQPFPPLTIKATVLKFDILEQAH